MRKAIAVTVILALAVAVGISLSRRTQPPRETELGRLQASAYVSPSGEQCAYLKPGSGWIVADLREDRSALLVPGGWVNPGSALPIRPVQTGAWAPDSARIAVVTSARKERMRLVVANVQSERTLTVDESDFIGQPAWSDTGRVLAWYRRTDAIDPAARAWDDGSRYHDNHIYELRVASIDDMKVSGVKTLYKGALSNVQWLPKLRSVVVFQPTRGFGVIDSDTKQARWMDVTCGRQPLSRAPMAMWRVSGDGGRLAFISCSGLWRCEFPSGRGLKKLAPYIAYSNDSIYPYQHPYQGSMVWNRRGDMLCYIHTMRYLDVYPNDDDDARIVPAYVYTLRLIAADGSRMRNLTGDPRWPLHSLQVTDDGSLFCCTGAGLNKLNTPDGW